MDLYTYTQLYTSMFGCFICKHEAPHALGLLLLALGY
jgi:hypothetical protein